jgi:hypothetical protein
MQRFLLASVLVVAACGGGQHPTKQTRDGILTMKDDRGESWFRIKPDGSIASDSGVTAMLTADGELRDGDRVIVRLGKDGALVLPDWPELQIAVRPDGSVVRDGRVVAEFGEGGVARGELIDAAGMQLVASGDPAARRKLMAVWVGTMMGMMAIGKDEGRTYSDAGQGSPVSYQPRPIDVKVVATAKTACHGAADAGVGGIVREHDGTPAIGATVVVTASGMMGELVALSDENGCFIVPNVPAGPAEVTIYFTDSTGKGTGTVDKQGRLRIEAALVGAPHDGGEVITIERGN